MTQMQTRPPAEQRDMLMRLHRHRTAYELVLSHPDGRCILLGYSASRSRGSLLSLLRRYGERVLRETGQDEIIFARRSRDGATSGEWAIRWTGRTHREAICSGEWPWIGSAAYAD